MRRVVYPADPKDKNKLAGTGRLPVVVMLHGNTPTGWLKKKPGGREMIANYHGFDYLQEYLAQNNIVSVSVDVNAAAFFESKFEMWAEMALEALDAMRKLCGEKDSRYFQRLDLNNVGLMGHSRSGDGVVRAARINAERDTNKRYGLKALCSLSPSDGTGTAKEFSIFANSNDRIKNQNAKIVPCPISLSPSDTAFYLVVYGGLDGDISGEVGADAWVGTGFRHYDRATCERSMVYLPHCGHNGFNRIWKDDPTAAEPGKDEKDLIDKEVSNGGRLRTPKEHRQLAIEYIGNMFRWRLTNETTLKGLFDGSSPNSLELPTSIQWSFGNVTDVETMENPAQGTTGTRKLEKSVIGRFAEVRPGLRDKTPHQTGVLAVDPNLAQPVPAVMKLTFDPAQNWLPFSLLTLRVTADFNLTAESTILAKKLPEFQLILSDSGGPGVPIRRVSIPHTHFFSGPDAASVLPEETFRHDAFRLASGQRYSAPAGDGWGEACEHQWRRSGGDQNCGDRASGRIPSASIF